MEFPALLSGPIIRRAEPSNVHIWVATSKKLHIRAALYQIKPGEQDAHRYEQLATVTKTETIHAGDNLCVHLAKITPVAGTLPVDTLLGYNLFLTSKNEKLDLGTLALLSANNPHSIVYGTLKYPSFYIQKNNPANILYGSCRKPHGKGNDAFIRADITINEHHLHLEKRPSSLFLMGDQIYADDVADPLFPIIFSLGKRIIGEKEQLGEIDERLKLPAFQSALDKMQGRQFIMEHFCKFTSGNAANHLIRFSEYATMYLLTFGPSLWESTQNENQLPTFGQVLENDTLHIIFPNSKRYKKQHAKELKLHRKRYRKQAKEVLSFKETLPKVRRVLANTPTYMIFDDHDITDDWNISKDWQDNVSAAPLGRHTIANGLAAYWLFQGWGNEPAAFDAHFSNTMSSYFHHFSVGTQNYNEWVEQLLDYESWHFVAPLNPKSLFLNTRTMRAFDVVPQPVRVGNIFHEDTNAPQLISRVGVERTSAKLLASGWNRGDPLIIVSPTPFYGIGIIESFLGRYVYPLRILGIQIRYDLDFEAWKYNGKGFYRFLKQIAAWNPANCIILSGDVHYAGAVKSEVEFSDNQKINIQQFTSSPIHNMSFTGVWGFLMKISIWFNGWKRKRRIIHRGCDENNNIVKGRNGNSQHLKWKEKIKYLSLIGSSIIVTRNNIGFLTVKASLVENRLFIHNRCEMKILPYARNQDQP